MKRGLCFFIVIFLITSLSLYSQNTGNVAGYVVNENGDPMVGVNVILKGTEFGTATDNNGYFTISRVPAGNYTLEASFIGYETYSKAILVTPGETIVLHITMKLGVIKAEEVVVTGYRVRKKGEVTGSVVSLGGDELEMTSQRDLTKSLQGKVSGTIITDRGGEPGSESAEIYIRGKSTLGDNAPLIVVDGVPGRDFSHLSPEDIESINILKDASASIYGARASNGVIVITTKRAKVPGKSQLRFTSEYTRSSFTRVPKMMNSYQYALYLNEGDARYGIAPTFTEEDIQKFKDGSSPLTHPSTDWYDAVFRDYAPEQHYNISYSGGSNNVMYYLSGDLLNQYGLLKSNDLNHRQYQIRSNVDAKITNYLYIGADLYGRLEKIHRPPVSTYDLFQLVQRAEPYKVDRYPNGLPGVGGENGQNPIIISSDKAGFDEVVNKVVNTKLSFRLDLSRITKGLELNGYGAYDTWISHSKGFDNIWTVYNYNPTTGEYEPQVGYSGMASRRLEMSTDVWDTEVYQLRMNYKRTFGPHGFDGFIAYEQEKKDWRSFWAYRRDLVSEKIIELFTGGQEEIDNTSESSESGRVSYIGALSYVFKNKYMFDFAIRRDGSSNFPRGKRFGTFPSVGAAWVISEEPFMHRFRSWMTNLKLRASWGKMGNDRVPSYQYLNRYSLDSYIVLGDPPVRINTLMNTGVANPNITWEESNMTNIGFDVNIKDRLLSISLDYFYEKRKNILITRSESVPQYTALSLPDENLGRVNNTGIELNLKHENNWGEVKYFVGGTFTYNHNEIEYMDEAENIPEWQKKEGHPMDSWLVYKTDGIYNTQEELESSVHPADAKVGDVKIVDLNGDGVITGDDMYRKYTSPVPEIQFGVNLGFKYKRLGCSIFIQGQGKAETMIHFTDLGNRPEYLFTERWTEDNPDSKYPAPYVRDRGINAWDTDFWLYDASYVRLKNIEITYDVPLKFPGLSNIKFFIRGTNLLTISKIKHFDPEINEAEGRYYPQLKKITTGFDIVL